MSRAEPAALRPEELEALLRQLLISHSRTGIDRIGPDDRITADCGLDSMALLETVIDLEETLGITLPEERMQELLTANFSEFVDFVHRQLDAARGME